eukprot:14679_1
MAFKAPYVFKQERLVVLQHAKGQTLRINPQNPNILDENGGHGKWAQWNIELENEEKDSKVIKLKHNTSNKYLRIHNNGNSIDVQGVGGKWTRFRVHKLGLNKAKLESVECHGKYIAVQPKGPGIGVGGKWCEFIFLRQGGGKQGFNHRKRCKIQLKGYHNKYVAAEKSGKTVCDRKDAKSYETFSSIPCGNGLINLLSTHGKYMSAQSNGTVVSDRKEAKGWETIAIQVSGDGYALKSSHGKYLSAQSNGSLQWNRDKIGAWEVFEINIVQ